MFDFDAGKLIIIGIVALIVIGPKELPRVMRQVGQAAAKMRRMAAEFRGQFMDAVREADMDEIKADVAKLAESAKADVGLDPLAEIKAELTQALDAAGKPATLLRGCANDSGPAQCGVVREFVAVPRLPEAPEEGAESACGRAGPGAATRRGDRRRDAGACRCARGRDGGRRASPRRGRRRETARQTVTVLAPRFGYTKVTHAFRNEPS